MSPSTLKSRRELLKNVGAINKNTKSASVDGYQYCGLKLAPDGLTMFLMCSNSVMPSDQDMDNVMHKLSSRLFRPGNVVIDVEEIREVIKVTYYID